MNPGGCAAGRSGKVSQVTCGLSEGSEVRGALNPPHGQGQREGNERSPGGVRKDNSQLGDVGGAETNAIEAVSDVDFSELVGRPEPGVGMDEVAQETGEGAAKLHGFRGCEPNRFRIDTRVGVVNNQPRPAVALRHDAERGETKVRDVEGDGEREHRPEALLAEVKDFLADECHVSWADLCGPRWRAR